MIDTKWKLMWDDSEEYIIFKEIDNEDNVITEFSLNPPRHGRLYYALKDWFGDK